MYDGVESVLSSYVTSYMYCYHGKCKIKRIYDGVEAKTRKSQASFSDYSSLIQGFAEDET